MITKDQFRQLVNDGKGKSAGSILQGLRDKGFVVEGDPQAMNNQTQQMQQMPPQQSMMSKIGDAMYNSDVASEFRSGIKDYQNTAGNNNVDNVLNAFGNPVAKTTNALAGYVGKADKLVGRVGQNISTLGGNIAPFDKNANGPLGAISDTASLITSGMGKAADFIGEGMATGLAHTTPWGRQLNEYIYNKGQQLDQWGKNNPETAQRYGQNIENTWKGVEATANLAMAAEMARGVGSSTYKAIKEPIDIMGLRNALKQAGVDASYDVTKNIKDFTEGAGRKVGDLKQHIKDWGKGGSTPTDGTPANNQGFIGRNVERVTEGTITHLTGMGRKAQASVQDPQTRGYIDQYIEKGTANGLPSERLYPALVQAEKSVTDTSPEWQSIMSKGAGEASMPTPMGEIDNALGRMGISFNKTGKLGSTEFGGLQQQGDLSIDPTQKGSLLTVKTAQSIDHFMQVAGSVPYLTPSSYQLAKQIATDMGKFFDADEKPKGTEYRKLVAGQLLGALEQARNQSDNPIWKNYKMLDEAYSVKIKKFQEIRSYFETDMSGQLRLKDGSISKINNALRGDRLGLRADLEQFAPDISRQLQAYETYRAIQGENIPGQYSKHTAEKIIGGAVAGLTLGSVPGSILGASLGAIVGVLATDPLNMYHALRRYYITRGYKNADTMAEDTVYKAEHSMKLDNQEIEAVKDVVKAVEKNHTNPKKKAKKSEAENRLINLKPKDQSNMDRFGRKPDTTEKLTPEEFKGFQDLSTNTIEKLKGRKFVTKQFIKDTLNQEGVNQIDRNAITKSLESYGDAIPVKEFADKVQSELLPLKRMKDLKAIEKEARKKLRSQGYTFTEEYGEGYLEKDGEYVDYDDLSPDIRKAYDNANYDNSETQDYSDINLPADEIADTAYQQHIYTTPFEADRAVDHWNLDNYFAHVRMNVTEKTAKVIEVQDDVNQYINKNNNMASMSFDDKKAILSDADFQPYKTMMETGREENLPERKEYLKKMDEKYKDDPKYKKSKQELKDRKIEDIYGLDRKKQAIIDNTNDTDNEVMQHYKELLNEAEKVLAYKSPDRTFRVIREEIKHHAQAGRTTMQFPTGETMAKVEGWHVKHRFTTEVRNGIPVNGDLMNIGDSIRDNAEQQRIYVTEMSGDGTFKAISAIKIRGIMREEGFESMLHNDIEEYIKQSNSNHDIVSASESYNLNTNDKYSKEQQTIMNFYDKTIHDYLKKIKPDMRKVTDEHDNQWFEFNLTPEDAKNPVLAKLNKKKAMNESVA